ncbi:hypothetical protein [Paenibacillus tuaregi]|uniref:hypothetical protein n=1 Tax=Paenibacillus tuaregi TaxID=1816681 RepID=UPI0008399784|nr:hypothetical protein [Paenibacillus tuaregi]
MTIVFTWIGFTCATLVVLALTYTAVVYLAYFAVIKTNVLSKVLRVFWRFYRTLPDSKFGRNVRYWALIYDTDTNTFAHAKALNREFQTEAEFEAMREKWRQQNTRKRGDKVDAA